MKKVGKAFETTQIALISVLLAVMVIVVFVATVGRYSKFYVTPWAEELTRFCMQWLALVGVGSLARHGGNFGVDVIVQRMPGNGKITMHMIQAIVITALCAWVTYYGIVTCQTQIKMNRTSPSMGIPMWIIYSVVPYCGISVCVQNLLYQFEKISAIRDEKL